MSNESPDSRVTDIESLGPDSTTGGDQSLQGWLKVASVAVLALIALSTLLSVNLFPVITNDSLTYIAYSDHLPQNGFVHAGYRQFGYPLFIEMIEVVGRFLGVEQLLLAVATQRLLLAVGLVYAVWLWRWWSLPVLAFGFSGEMIAYTNLVLTEGLSIPLALLLACTFGHFIRIRSADSYPVITRVLVVSVALLSLMLLTIRFPFAVFGLCPLLVAIASPKTKLERLAWSAFGVFSLLGVITLGLMSAENAEEYGDFSPSTGGERTEYWAAWVTVFRLRPEMAAMPELSDYYANGDPYLFIHGVDGMELPKPEKAELFDSATADLLQRAGLGTWETRFESFLGALRAGRIDDLEGLGKSIMATNRASLDAVMHSNALRRSDRPDAFAESLNDGRLPEAVITAPLALRLPLPAAQVIAAFFFPLALLVLMWGTWDVQTRLLSIGGFVPPVAYAAMIGYVRGDNFRFMTTLIMFAVGAAGAVLSTKSTSRAAAMEAAI